MREKKERKEADYVCGEEKKKKKGRKREREKMARNTMFAFKNLSSASTQLSETRLDDIAASCQTKILNSRYLLG